MPRTKQQNEQIRNQRKQTLLTAALEVYVDKGYAAAEIGEIAQRAALARGLVYYYFKDKATLFRELFQFMISRAEQNARTFFETEECAIDRLHKYASNMLNNVLQNQQNANFFMRMGHDLPLIFSAEERKALRWPQTFMSILTATMQRGMDDGTVRRMNPSLLAKQYWATLMFAKAHLMEAIRGKDSQQQAEILASLHQDVQDAVYSCVILVRSTNEPTSKSDTEPCGDDH